MAIEVTLAGSKGQYCKVVRVAMALSAAVRAENQNDVVVVPVPSSSLAIISSPSAHITSVGSKYNSACDRS